MEEDGAEAASADDAELEPGEQPVPKRRKPSGAAVSSAEQVACMAATLMLRPLHQRTNVGRPLSACNQSCSMGGAVVPVGLRQLSS